MTFFFFFNKEKVKKLCLSEKAERGPIYNGDFIVDGKTFFRFH